MSDTVVGSGLHQFVWQEPWAKDEHHEHSQGWAHHGIVVTSTAEVLTPHVDRPEMLVLDRDGTLLRSWPLDVVSAHGITLVRDNGVEQLWIADAGSKRVREADGSYPKVGPHNPLRGAAVKYSLDGQELLRLPMPGLPVYDEGDYCPTQVAVDEARLGGSGDVWVADGYGQNLVHRFDRSGRYLDTIDGTDGAGQFNQPHAICIDRRGMYHELLVADRQNRRVQVYDMDGRYLRCFGEDYLVSPSAFASWGSDLVIAELDGRLTIVGPDGRLVRYLGETRDGRARPGWPNAVDAESGVVSPPLSAGRFNSPHGLAVDADLNLYVTEWLVGGRLVKLAHFRQA